MTRVERECAARVLERINYMQCTGDPTIDEQKRAVDTAIAALRGERDTTTTSWYSKKLYCDTCGERIIGKKHNFCPMCGRKLEVEG